MQVGIKPHYAKFPQVNSVQPVVINPAAVTKVAVHEEHPEYTLIYTGDASPAYVALPVAEVLKRLTTA
jgi:hypothetical protein